MEGHCLNGMGFCNKIAHVYLAGGTDGKMCVYDLQTGEAIASHSVAADTVNGLQFHPFLPVMATASGEPVL